MLASGSVGRGSSRIKGRYREAAAVEESTSGMGRWMTRSKETSQQRVTDENDSAMLGRMRALSLCLSAQLVKRSVEGIGQQDASGRSNGHAGGEDENRAATYSATADVTS